MTDQDKLRLVRLFYAALMVDSAANYERFGIEGAVGERKSAEQGAAARGQMTQLGIRAAGDIFTVLSEIFGCAAWVVEESEAGARGVTETCLACAVAKKRGEGRPCSLYCINPFEAYVGALDSPARLVVEETLWEGNRCVFSVIAADPRSARC
jgi:hypothetical protein